MGRFIKGDVVVVPFPFSDLSASKRRPAYIVATLTGDDVILCQITSQGTRDQQAVPLTANDFVEGGLRRDSNIPPNLLCTSDSTVILSKTGTMSHSKIQEITTKIIAIISS